IPTTIPATPSPRPMRAIVRLLASPVLSAPFLPRTPSTIAAIAPTKHMHEHRPMTPTTREAIDMILALLSCGPPLPGAGGGVIGGCPPAPYGDCPWYGPPGPP